MAKAIHPLKRLQYAREATKGTDLPTTRLFLGDSSYKEEATFFRDATPRGIVTTVGGAGIITHKGTTFSLGSKVGCHYIMLPLLSGILGNVSPTGAGADKTWTFARSSLAVSNPTLDAFTFEYVESDGATNHIARAAHYCMCQKFSLNLARGNPTAEWTSEWFGRASQAETLTASITAQSNYDVALIPSEAWKVFLDTTYAGIGGTQLVGVLVSAALDVNFGTMPITSMDGRADLDFFEHKVESMNGTFKLTMELDAVSAAIIANWRANSLQYFRLKGTGVALGGSNYSVQFDFAARYTGTYGISYEGENAIVSLDLELVYDTTGTQIMTAVIVNDLAAIANI